MARCRKSKENLYKLEQEQRKLIAEVNKMVQQARKEQCRTTVSPQLLRLAGLHEYRKRDLDKIKSLLDSPELLQEHVAVIDNSTGVIVRGGEALERYSRYVRSGIFHASKTRVALPTEAELTLTNFEESVEEAFPDAGVYWQFNRYLDKAIEQDPTIASDSLWKAQHNNIDTNESGRPKTAAAIQSTKQYWMFKNRDNIQEITNAIARLSNIEGEREVVERLREAGDDIVDTLIIAAIGYNESSARAAQTILKVLLPSSVHSKAMSLGEIPEVDDFNNEVRYE
jgi:hypothetical protein